MVGIEVVPVEKPDESINVIVGYSHFIKTVEDVYEALVTAVPGIKFGMAFCEASGPRLIRHDGTDEELVQYAIKNCENIGAGHSFIILLRNAYPINVLNTLKNVQEITRILVASANPLQVIVGETEQGRAILGVVDGFSPLGVENEAQKKERREFLRKIGYKQ
ncbi:MAG: adenosine monophosphate-protein transferase [Euryarchaeota archaeon]|nr:adenosine monophosphate-protein transferase [Euryarchaeota archaeon]